jgi:DNA-binding GntR family transcriptional regulator
METTTFSRETLSSRVCGQLRHEILKGTIRAGERLSEHVIAERFGVSPTPVREAFRLLTNDGLVQYVDRRGVHVIDLGEREIFQAFSVRSVLEREALREALVHMNDADKKRLMELAERTENARGKPAHVLLEIDRQFHGFFVDRSRNVWLKEFSGRVSNVLTVARLDLFNAPDLDTLIAEHVAIAQAVLDDDFSRADAALAAHIRRVRDNAISARKRLAETAGASEKGDA